MATAHERIYLPVQTRNVIHRYSDRALLSAQVRCLKLEEMLAAKLKCLLQRRHSADLYDFVNATLINPVMDLNRRELVDAFLKMTIFGSGPGIVADLLVGLPFQILRGLWEKHLILPNNASILFDSAVDHFKTTATGLFGVLPKRFGEFAYFPPELRNPIMDAAQSMTLLKVVYEGREREVEPYSLQYKTRKDGIAREYLYVYDRTGGRSGPGVKSLVRQGFQQITNTEIPFEPRFEVELAKAGEPATEPYFPARRGTRRTLRTLPTLPTLPTMRQVLRHTTAKYVVECPICGKRFARKTAGTQLNPHKDRYGNRCLGRRGIRG
jgi:hypothetical protein